MAMKELAQHVARRSGRGTPKRDFTRELKAEQAKGRVVVVSLQPYAGQEVAYLPRAVSDPKPWVQTDRHGPGHRYSGRECHAAPACGEKFINGRTCVRPGGHDKAHSTH